LWWSVLSVEKTGSEVPGENHQPTASHWQILSHNVVRVHLTMNHKNQTKAIKFVERKFKTIYIKKKK
jgi:hypothetical protein